jgi:hypothetical protein
LSQVVNLALLTELSSFRLVFGRGSNYWSEQWVIQAE